jgi:hypothetical protein
MVVADRAAEVAVGKAAEVEVAREEAAGAAPMATP